MHYRTPLVPSAGHLAIVAGSDKSVQFASMHGSTTLSRCFREIGFAVSFYPDVYRFARMPPQRLPDFLAVDITLGDYMLDAVEQLLESKVFPNHTTVILYNFPNLDMIHTRRFYRNTYYLGTSFTDRDLFSIASRVFNETRALERRRLAALEGEIFDESLIEVFQLLEIGRKSGCMLVNNNGPFGLVYVYEGRITYAMSGASTGKSALLDMLNLSSGSFKFAIDRYYNRRNCDITISEILMDWAHTIDETRNYQALTSSGSTWSFDQTL